MSQDPLGTGMIHRDGTGTAEFPVRGKMQLTWRKHDRENATLRVTSSMGTVECQCIWAYGSVDDDGVPFDWTWHGFIIVEGYEMRVSGVRDGDVLRLTFIDTIQPYTGPVAVLDENGQVAA